MCHHERSGHDLEAEHPLYCCLFDPRTSKDAHAFAVQILRNPAQYFRQIRPGAATRVQDINIVRRQPVRNIQVVLQCFVYSGDHVADHFGGGVPDAELFAEVRVKGFEEGFVEIGHGVAFVEAGEEGCAVHAVKGRSGPV